MDPAAAADDPAASLRRPLFPSLSSRLRLQTPLFSELSGSVGDLGTFIPIALSLSLVNNLDLGTTLLFSSLYNALTGLLFDLPIPVQPMKSIAAVAISPSSHLSLPQIMAAGLSTASALLLLAATGLISVLYRLLPLPVVRAVQLSQGLSFTFSAVSYIRYNQDFAAGQTSGERPVLGSDGLVLALSAFLFILLSSAARRRTLIPSALVVFAVGFVLCFVRDRSVLTDLKFGPSPIRVVKITREDWKVGFVRGAIPQIPLSVLNSVIAVCKLSGDLFPGKEISPAAVSVSVGLMNWAGCWFGAMPVCHGAGGLAGQYRFGGRSGLSVMFLAAGKLVVGLVFGNAFVVVLRQFPVGLLGVLLLFSGVELAMAARDMGSKRESFVMLVSAAVSMKLDAAVGFGCGLVVVLVLWIGEVDWMALWRRRRGGEGVDDNKAGSGETEEEISGV